LQQRVVVGLGHQPHRAYMPSEANKTNGYTWLAARARIENQIL
jgi:hypothetical protein